MKTVLIAAVAAALLSPALASAAIPCSDLPKAEQFIHTRLRPGPNTRRAEYYVDRARHARNDRECSDDLAQADVYAKRSAAADRRAAEQHP